MRFIYTVFLDLTIANNAAIKLLYMFFDEYMCMALLVIHLEMHGWPSEILQTVFQIGLKNCIPITYV